ncbi:MAG: glycosyltransferase family 4 protein [Armatimonadota bacterium]|nr:glycosyltransferase family 4 protein [Armatimonadota bacterium]
MSKRPTGRTLLAGPRIKSVTTGASVAFELLVEGFRSRGLPFFVVDVDPGAPTPRAGAFHLGRALAMLRMLVLYLVRLPWCARGYLLISSSPLGFVRDLLTIWPARVLGRRMTLHYQGGGYADFYHQQAPWFQGVIRATLRQADALVVLSESLRSQFDFLGDASPRICVVPNAVSPDLRPPDNYVKQLPESGPVRILYLSNMQESKGYLDVLAACRILRHERGRHIHCDFCGEFVATVVDGNQQTTREARQRFYQLVEEWKLEDVVTYHGTVQGETKREMLLQAHVLALPTSYPWEGQPICILEALAFATPVVATPYRAIPDQVRDGHNGALVPPSDPEALADAIERICSDRARYAQMSQNAQRTYLSRFTSDQHLQRLIAIILGEDSASSPVAAPHP